MKLKYQQLVSSMPQKSWSLVLVIINLTTVLSVMLAKNLLPPVVPLFYGNPYGAEQLAPRESLALPAMAALGICILSIITGSLLKDDFIKKILFGGMAFTTALSLITTIKIIFLVGNI